MAVSVDDFLRAVLKSGVLERDRLHAILQKMPATGREQSKSVAEFLIKKKSLTPFQAKKLLEGGSTGLKLGPYIIQTPIGKGGMGTVYLARDTRDNQSAAIKVVSPKRVQESERHLARFQREMKLSQTVRHPNIAVTRDSGEVRGVHYLAFDFIPGVTLYRLVTRDGPLEPNRAARLFIEVASALEYAHAGGLIHRDMKPTNIMITPDDHAKILDLGLAMIEGEEVDDPEIVGGKGFIVGSVDYIAPEQTRDPTQVDGRADLYSMGCSMYFALTGQGPFPSGDTKDKVRAHRHLDAEPIRRRNPNVPEALADLVQRLMAKDPASRPASATVVRTELLALGAAPAPFACSTESSVMFELIEEVTDAPDTLSEVFHYGETDDDSPMISRESVRSLFDRDGQAMTMVWLLLAAAIMGMAVLFLVVMMGATT